MSKLQTVCNPKFIRIHSTDYFNCYHSEFILFKLQENNIANSTICVLSIQPNTVKLFWTTATDSYFPFTMLVQDCVHLQPGISSQSGLSLLWNHKGIVRTRWVFTLITECINHCVFKSLPNKITLHFCKLQKRQTTEWGVHKVMDELSNFKYCPKGIVKSFYKHQLMHKRIGSFYSIYSYG